MAITVEGVKDVYKKVDDGDYKSYFFVPDFEKQSGGIKYIYDHVRCMNQNGFNAVILHQKPGFQPKWLEEYYPKTEDGKISDVNFQYLDDGKLQIKMEDFFFIPEGYPQLMENLQQQNAPCKRIAFCLNWFYVLNALQPGIYWNHYGVFDCLSITHVQSDYLKMIMPFLRIKEVVGKVDPADFSPPVKMTDKKLQAAFIPSRDGGLKSYNVIKTFYALFPHLRFMQFKEIKNVSKADYSEILKESAFYIHFDEFSSMGTAPLEAWLSKCLVAGWDGVGGREYMSTDNMWLAQNSDVVRLALAIGKMVETYIMHDIPQSVWDSMESATMLYSPEAEKDSVIKVHNEYKEERLKELEKLMEMIKETEENNG